MVAPTPATVTGNSYLVREWATFGTPISHFNIQSRIFVRNPIHISKSLASYRNTPSLPSPNQFKIFGRPEFGPSVLGRCVFRVSSGSGVGGGFGGSDNGKSGGGGGNSGGGSNGSGWSLLSCKLENIMCSFRCFLEFNRNIFISVIVEKRYMSLLAKYPVMTKAVTSALLTLLVIDQVPSLDLKRTFTFTLLGLVLVDPILHFWYLYLSNLVTAPGASGAFLRLFLDQFLFSPIFIGTFLSTLVTLGKAIICNSKAKTVCQKCPEHVKEEIREFIEKKQQVKDQINVIPHFDDVAEEEVRWETEQEQQNIVDCKHNISCSGEGSSVASTMTSKKQTQLGPINLYFTKESNETMQQRKGKEAKVIDEAKKKLRENAVQICRWMYDAGLPFNAVNYGSLGPAIEAIGQYGPGMEPPSYYEVRVKYLKKELEHTNNILALEEDQAKYGCSLMADGWTDRKHRSLINFLVNSPKGTKFIGSVDASSYSHMAHCINLMFEDFFKIPNLKKTYEQAVMINGYIYNRSPLLDMLRDFIAKRDMVRPAKTRFATAFLTLKRFHTEKANLKKMFTSEKWTKSKCAK
ncbi:UNVERIFIED_CONTAM: hypothetical protein Slati_1275400 [Sesamum latifolium]|uniref:DUF659 domain-containing protein n=1 Tax=Sesamum latifolium TaxID=2727402 RepID=A0AAW2XGR3_9LAMI